MIIQHVLVHFKMHDKPTVYFWPSPDDVLSQKKEIENTSEYNFVLKNKQTNKQKYSLRS